METPLSLHTHTHAQDSPLSLTRMHVIHTRTVDRQTDWETQTEALDVSAGGTSVCSNVAHHAAPNHTFLPHLDLIRRIRMCMYIKSKQEEMATWCFEPCVGPTCFHHPLLLLLHLCFVNCVCVACAKPRVCVVFSVCSVFITFAIQNAFHGSNQIPPFTRCTSTYAGFIIDFILVFWFLF